LHLLQLSTKKPQLGCGFPGATTPFSVAVGEVDSIPGEPDSASKGNAYRGGNQTSHTWDVINRD